MIEKLLPALYRKTQHILRALLVIVVFVIRAAR